MENNQIFSRNKKMIYIALTSVIFVLLVIFRASFGIIFVAGNLVTIMFIVFLSKSAKQHRSLSLLSKLSKIVYGLFVLTFFIIEGYILYQLHATSKFEPKEIDSVIILGAGLKGEIPSITLETRLKTGVAFLKENPEIPVIVSGGQGPGETITEAAAMGKYLQDHGISEHRIHYEDRSTSTYENLTYSKNILKQLDLEKSTVLIITSDYHLVRANIIADQLGIKNFGLSAESPFIIKINYFIREYFAIIKTMVEIR